MALLFVRSQISYFITILLGNYQLLKIKINTGINPFELHLRFHWKLSPKMLAKSNRAYKKNNTIKPRPDSDITYWTAYYDRRSVIG